MDIVKLEGLVFFAYHGFYEEEQKIGNRYEIDITVYTDLSPAAQSDKLKDTINYEVLYQITQQVMKEPSKLLENIALRIIEQVKAAYPTIETCEVKVAKMNPPIGGVCEKAVVILKR